ncbi:uncharacterized protein TNCV_3285601 [Trichonephila clavipes]|nr:uncharacterized protein TNCV_3285601 [Trichonephila clavipes]
MSNASDIDVENLSLESYFENLDVPRDYFPPEGYSSGSSSPAAARNRSRSPAAARNRSRSPAAARNRSRSPAAARNRSRSPVVQGLQLLSDVQQGLLPGEESLQVQSRSPAANANCQRSSAADRHRSRSPSPAARVNRSRSPSPAARVNRSRSPSASNSSRSRSPSPGPSNRQHNRRRRIRKFKVQRSPYLNWGNSRRELVYDYPPHRLTFHNDDKDFTVRRIPNKACSYLLSHCSKTHPIRRDTVPRNAVISIKKRRLVI